MTNLESLVVLLAEAERERDIAAAAAAAARTALAAADAQAEQLLAYRREYEARWSDRFCREGQIELVRCYQGFMERLSQAVEHQAAVAADAAAHIAVVENVLRQCEVRAASVKKVIERRVEEARAIADRREQKIGDELASRAAWSRLNAARLASAG